MEFSSTVLPLINNSLPRVAFQTLQRTRMSLAFESVKLIKHISHVESACDIIYIKEHACVLYQESNQRRFAFRASYANYSQRQR